MEPSTFSRLMAVTGALSGLAWGLYTKKKWKGHDKDIQLTSEGRKRMRRVKIFITILALMLALAYLILAFAMHAADRPWFSLLVLATPILLSLLERKMMEQARS